MPCPCNENTPRPGPQGSLLVSTRQASALPLCSSLSSPLPTLPLPRLRPGCRGASSRSQYPDAARAVQSADPETCLSRSPPWKRLTVSLNRTSTRAGLAGLPGLPRSSRLPRLSRMSRPRIAALPIRVDDPLVPETSCPPAADGLFAITMPTTDPPLAPSQAKPVRIGPG